MTKVQANRPYHYHHWMVVIQRWEPVISSTFPSQIPFWISLQGLPLHYWHDKMIYNIGQDLGHLEDYHISKTSARVRILVDAFKPLIKDPLIEFDSGEELVVSLDYEDLKSHCSLYFMLTHASDDCPPVKQQQKLEVQKGPSTTSSFTQYQAPNARDGHKSSPPETYTRVDSVREPFHQRIDRHGNPFGSRIPIAVTRGQPLKNKLIPSRGRSEASDIPRQLEDHQHTPGGAMQETHRGILPSTKNIFPTYNGGRNRHTGAQSRIGIMLSMLLPTEARQEMRLKIDNH